MAHMDLFKSFAYVLFVNSILAGPKTAAEGKKNILISIKIYTFQIGTQINRTYIMSMPHLYLHAAQNTVKWRSVI